MRPFIVSALFAACVFLLTACGEHDVTHVPHAFVLSEGKRRWCEDQDGIIFVRETNAQVCCFVMSEFFAMEGRMSCWSQQHEAFVEKGL